MATLLAAEIGSVLGKRYKFRQQVKFRVSKRVEFIEKITDHVLVSVPKEDEWVSLINAAYLSMMVLVLLPHSLDNNLEKEQRVHGDEAWWLNACRDMMVRNSNM